MCKFLLLFLLLFGKSSAKLQAIEASSSDLAKFVCTTSHEAARQDIKTIAILTSNNNYPSSFFDELYKCMPVNVSMTQSDINQASMNKKLKEAKFVIVIGDKIDMVNI